jgi:cytochrome c peroxidase
MKLESRRGRAALNVVVLSGAFVIVAGAAAQTLPAPVQNTDYFFDGAPAANKVLLGKNLFWDKLLSGNNDVSCGTCHNPQFGTGDSLSLGLGAGGDGGGMLRVANTARNRIVRNALPLYNSGARVATAFGNDGDVMLQTDGTFATPAGVLPNASLVADLDNQLAAQALFPLMAAREQAGIDPSNPLSACALAGDFACTWSMYVDKIRAVPDYVTLFKQVYPSITDANGIKINHVVNAIGAYETVAFRSDDSPFDRFLRGDATAMSPAAVAGMNLFYGSAGCSTCHSGVFQTDRKFHAIAMPQIGPGRQSGVNGKDDGRFRNTFISSDRHKYKTPSLRNVAISGPWSHAGAYTSLEAVIRHHLDPVASLNNYDTTQAILPPIPANPQVASIDFKEWNDLTARAARAATNELPASSLSDTQVNQLVAFMHALTGDSVMNFKDKIPLTVLSKLPVAD